MDKTTLTAPASDTQQEALIQGIQQGLDAVETRFKIDPEGCMREAREALKLAETVEPGTWRARCWNAMGIACGAGGDYPAAITWFRKAIEYFEAADDIEHLIPSLANLCHILTFAEQFAEALHTGLGALDLVQNTDEQNLAPAVRRKQLFTLYNHICGIYGHLGDFTTALTYAQRVAELIDEKDLVAVAKNYDQFAALHGNLGDLDAAVEYGRKAWDVMAAFNNPYDKGVIAGNLGHIYLALFREDGSQNTLAEAIDYARQALDNFRAAGAPNRELVAMLSLGWIYLDAGNFAQAIRQLRPAIELAEKLGKHNTFARACFGMARACRLLGRLPEAEAYLRRGEDIVAEMRQDALESRLDLLLEKYQLYKQRGDVKNALICHESYTALYQEKLNAEQRKFAAEMKVRFDVERAQRERAIAQKDKELFKQQSRQLQQEVELKTKRITLTGLLLGQRNEILTKIKREALANAKNPSAVHECLQNIAGLVSEHLDSAEAWETFNAEFELLHHDFISKLSRRYPLLTGVELKLCALITINLSSKEIARLLCISSRSIETYRYRIRKKLGLSRQDNLTALLAAL